MAEWSQLGNFNTVALATRSDQALGELTSQRAGKLRASTKRS